MLVFGMSISASQLRQDVYRLLDQVLATGEPLEIIRRGRTLRIVADTPGSKISRIRPAVDFVHGDPDDLVEIEWSQSWQPDQTLAP